MVQGVMVLYSGCYDVVAVRYYVPVSQLCHLENGRCDSDLSNGLHSRFDRKDQYTVDRHYSAESEEDAPERPNLPAEPKCNICH